MTASRILCDVTPSIRIAAVCLPIHPSIQHQPAWSLSSGWRQRGVSPDSAVSAATIIPVGSVASSPMVPREATSCFVAVRPASSVQRAMGQSCAVPRTPSRRHARMSTAKTPLAACVFPTRETEPQAGAITTGRMNAEPRVWGASHRPSGGRSAMFCP